MMQVIDKYINTKAELGRHDCLLMALEALDQQDTIKAIRKRYTSMRGARRVLPQIVGYPSPETFLCSVAMVIEPAFARGGDVVLLDAEHFGIITDSGQILMADSNNIFRIHQWAYLQNCPVFRRKE